jgi:hypothetical protein
LSLAEGATAPSILDRLSLSLTSADFDHPRAKLDTPLQVTELIGLDDPLARFDVRATEETRPYRGRVSVIVCTRGRPQELDHCLKSLIETSISPDEIIVVDNTPQDEDSISIWSQC